MQVKYAKPVMYVFLGLGAFLFVAGLALSLLLGTFQFSMLSGLILLVFSILGLNNPMLVLEGDELQARNLLGMTLKRHPVSQLLVETDAKGARRLVRMGENGKTRQVMREKTVFFDRADTEAMIAAFASKAFSAVTSS